MNAPGGFAYYALRPLRHFADFRGRSTRSELVAWYVASLVAAAVVHLAASVVAYDAAPTARHALELLLLCPTVAVMVRRLHDAGVSGWWILLGAPAWTDNLYRDWQVLTTEARMVSTTLPGAVIVVLLLALLALVALLLRNDDPEPNRWGPNPRYDAPQTA